MSVLQPIKKCVRWLCPYGILEIHRERFLRLYEQKHPKETAIRNYFLGLKRDEQHPEIIEIIDYFSKYKFSVFPCEYTRKYHAADIDVFRDASSKMRYVLHNGKKLYFPRGWSAETVRQYYNGLCVEQDAESPHRYETKEFTVNVGEHIADIGAAEGIWALNYAETAGKIYLFECEKRWIKALQKTFEPWKEKVIIVNKYVTNTTGGKNVSLDEFFKSAKIDVIKADIEGAEIGLLEGGKTLLEKTGGIKLLLCAYHKENDAKKLKEILENAGFTTEYSKRYMLFVFDPELKEPYIRRGLIRAKK
jgi:ribosomal protein L7/L12